MVACSRRFALIAAVVVVVAHVIANPHYGFFRDELYFVICGRRPAFGYVDQPPLVPLLAACSQLFGPSLVLARSVAAAFAGASIYVTCRLAAELGGGRFAQRLAALACAMCPVLCNFGMKLATDTVGLWTWPLIALCVLRLAKGADPRGWLTVGALLGVSVLAKYTVVYFAVALAIGLACTRAGRIFASRYAGLGLAVAVALALPNFVWQAAHGFPMLEVLEAGRHGKNIQLSAPAYLVAQVTATNPVLALAWVAGLIALARDATTRFLAIGFCVLLAAMIASRGKYYYPADAYPILFAAGGVALARLTRVARMIAIAVAATAGLASIPYVEPVLPLPLFARYNAMIGGQLAVLRTEHLAIGALPQDWADMQGWPELARSVAGVVRALPPDDRARVALVASNYGEAAAIDFFGAKYGLPPVLGGHNQYFLWGPRGYTGDVVIDVHGDCGAGSGLFDHAELAAVARTPLAMPFEQATQIMVCRGIRRPLAELWPALKLYY